MTIAAEKPFKGRGVEMGEHVDPSERDRKTGVWYVLHVKPRTEKKSTEFLRHYHCWHHLPLTVKITRVQRRKVKRELPLFPGYVFARLNADQRLAMLKTNLIVRLIEIPRPRETIHQLRQIEHAGRTGHELRKVATFKSGVRVRITSGPFYGIEGRVLRDEGGVSVVLNIDILGQAVAVSVSPSECEPVESGD